MVLSAEQIAGRRRRGKKGEDVRWHGRQRGYVQFPERKVRVEKPRLRRRGGGAGAEVSIPAYEALQDDGVVSERMLEILMKGVSTRNYGAVLPQMAESVGMSRSSVSRQVQVATEKQLQELCERRFDAVDLLVLYIDGVRFGPHHVIVVVGVDGGGGKHLLGLREGASENQVVVTELLTDLVERGVRVDVPYLFVIDGSKALRSAIDRVFGEEQAVQRCRLHKVRNVVDQVPKELKPQVRSAMKAAYKLSAREGMDRLKQQARWLEVEHPDAAASLLEGLEETFTVNRLELPPSLHRCLTNTNVIENPNSALRRRTRRVTRWRDGSMVKRWATAAFLDAEEGWRKIMGHRDLWMLRAALGREDTLPATGTEE